MTDEIKPVDSYTTGKPVACYECVDRRGCPRVRIDKYAKRPCSMFKQDLLREAVRNERQSKK